MKLLFFPKYTEKGASSRYRIYQYIEYFKRYKCEVYPFFDNNYVPAQKLKNLKGLWYLFKSYIKRLYAMACIKKEDIVILQYEFTQFLFFNSPFFSFFKIKYIVDFDDAVFHNYDQHSNKLVRYFFKNKISKVISHAHSVITGSPYLTAYASKYNNRVVEIPTSIDMQRYIVDDGEKSNKKFVIGWIGSSTTSLHLKCVVDAFRQMLKNKIEFEIRLIGYDKKEGINFEGLPVKYIDWDDNTEINELNKFDVGIMPLIDFPFARGKCAFKLIQYMALAKPTISSRFEANLKVDRNKENLFADTTQEWLQCIQKIINDRELYKKIGLRNRSVIMKEYAIQSNAEKYLKIIKSIDG